jgi:hypothetical protein
MIYDESAYDFLFTENFYDRTNNGSAQELVQIRLI